MNNIRSSRTVWCTLALTIFLTGWFDFLFWDVGAAGFNVAAFAAALLSASIVTRFKRIWKRRTVSALIALGGLIASMALSPQLLNSALFFIGLCLINLNLRSPALGFGVRAWARMRRPIRSILGRSFVDAHALTIILNRRCGRRNKKILSFGKWILPIAGALCFMAIFRSANPIIEYFLRSVVDAIDKFLDNIMPARVICWGVIGFLLWGMLRFRACKSISHSATAPFPSMPNDMAVRCLLTFNAVFAVQVVTDAFYLWGGRQLPRGMTYATYAHQGAFGLGFAVSLAAIFILVAFRHGSAASDDRRARRLLYVWIFQNFLLLEAALERIYIYVQAYLLTMLRLEAIFWMALIAGGLILTVIRLAQRRSNVWLIHANVLMVTAALYLCCFFSFGEIVGEYNVRHAMEHGGLSFNDLAYLDGLGESTLPALARCSLKVGCVKLFSRSDQRENDREFALRIELKDWRTWTVQRWMIARALDAVEQHAQ